MESLKEIARFCGRNNLHLISDEVFAISVYENSQAANITPFTSLLEMNLDDSIDPHLVHVAYGMGKDFCAAGLHLGALHSKNQGLIAAVSSIWYVAPSDHCGTAVTYGYTVLSDGCHTSPKTCGQTFSWTNNSSPTTQRRTNKCWQNIVRF